MSIQFHLDDLEIDGLKQKISTLSTSTVHHRLLITCKDDDDNKFSITLSLDDVATILFYLLTQPGIPKNCSLKKLITAWMDTPAITCKDRTRIRYALDIDVLSAATDSSNSPSDSAPENQPSISEPNSHTSKTTGHQGQTTTDILEPTSPPKSRSHLRESHKTS